jgi:hypothetical protein
MSYKIVQKLGDVETLVTRETAQEALSMGVQFSRNRSEVFIAGPDGVRMTLEEFRAKHGLQGQF